VFSLTDPLPALQELWETLISLIKTDVKAFASRILPKSVLAYLRIYRNLPSQLRSIFLRQVFRRVLGMQPILFRPGGKKINKILFVCLGNIIRSPTAAMLLQHRIADIEIKSLEIASAGLWKGLSQNNPRSSPDAVITIAAEWNIALKIHRSQPITRKLIDSCDAIFVMDYQNESMLLLQFPDVKHKVFLLGACVKRTPMRDWEIADPYGGTAHEIRKCVSTINDRVSGLVQILSAHGKADIDFDHPIDAPMTDI
jgi:protein-tyrosine-phosphatase